MWRLWDLSAFPVVTPVLSRFINESEEGMSRVAGDDDPLLPPSPYDEVGGRATGDGRRQEAVRSRPAEAGL